MVVLGRSPTKVEVRIVKPPFKASPRSYFEEYEKYGTPHPPNNECHLYIVPEDTKYGVEVTLKKGFSYASYLGVEVQFYDTVSKAPIGSRVFPKDEDGATTLSYDKRYFIKSLSDVVVDGEFRKKARFTFCGLATDENLQHSANGTDSTELGGIHIEIYRYGKAKLEEISEEEFQKQLEAYELQLSAMKSGTKKSGTITHPQKVDLKTFHKDGVTHRVGLVGGTAIQKRLEKPTKQQHMYSVSKSLNFYFLCRRSDFFERNSIAKAPIPIECQPWDCLKDHERSACFKTLQTYDKEQTLKQKIAEAGPGADPEAIKRQVMETGIVPNRWRIWNSLWPHERKDLFLSLQLRRKHFEKGETPPEDGKLGTSVKPALSPKEEDQQPRLMGSVPPAQISNTVRPLLEYLAEKKIEPKPTKLTKTKNTTVKIEDRPMATVKGESKEARPLQRNVSQPEVIVIDDSPPRTNKRSLAKFEDQHHQTIKCEPADRNEASQKPGLANDSGFEVRESKKVKLEPSLTISDGGEDAELVKLKEEGKRREEELMAAQRAAEAAQTVAELIRERNERMTKIAALESKRT